jgi:hypothetical protein
MGITILHDQAFIEHSSHPIAFFSSRCAMLFLEAKAKSGPRHSGGGVGLGYLFHPTNLGSAGFQAGFPGI